MNLSGARVLITGGAGFIGSHIVDDLVRAGAQVRVLDDLSSGSLENLSEVRWRVDLIRGSILDPDVLKGAVRGVDFVSHQAAQLEILRAVDDPTWDLQVNTVGTLNVLDAARTQGVKRVVLASSACVYGQTRLATSEDTLPRPNWAYGVSKLTAEHYARLYSEQYGLPTVSLRYAIVYGEREWYRRALTIFIRRAMEKQPPVVFGTGRNIRDLVHVEDVVRFNRLCLEADDIPNLVYNVGTGQAVSIRDLATAVLEVAEVDGPPLFEDVAEGEASTLVPGKRRNPSDLEMMLLDCSRAFRDMGWSPRISLREGIRRELEWARQNTHRWIPSQRATVNEGRAYGPSNARRHQ